MSFQLDNNDATYQVRSYQPGEIRINEVVYKHSLIISPHQLIESWAPQTVAELKPESFLPILDLAPDILLIGTGNAMVILSVSLYGELINRGIGVEVMNTSAACRTYNALSSENRRVVAALLL